MPRSLPARRRPYAPHTPEHVRPNQISLTNVPITPHSSPTSALPPLTTVPAQDSGKPKTPQTPSRSRSPVVQSHISYSSHRKFSFDHHDPHTDRHTHARPIG